MGNLGGDTANLTLAKQYFDWVVEGKVFHSLSPDQGNKALVGQG